MTASTTAPAQARTGLRAEAVVDLPAIRANVRTLVELIRSGGNSAANVMAVVKADGYGHGAVPAARAALAGGATRLGVATPAEALELRAAGVAAPILAWLWPPGEPVTAALAAGVELGVSGLAQLDAVLAQAGSAVPGIHLKVDTGLGRGGVGPAEVAGVLDAVAGAQRAGRVRVVGLMSHLASADVPGDPSVVQQTGQFRRILDAAAGRGIHPPVRHLANTAGLIDHPDTRFDLARVGIGLYGLNPVGTAVPLRPAMTLRSTVALTKRVPAGHGVSYGLTYHTAADTTLALIPLGYADGLPRAASNRGEILVAGRRRRIAGRVAMDQVVVDCGDDPVAVGDPAIVFGPGHDGEPTAREWAGFCDTIDYEIVTRIGPRVPRRHIESPGDEPRIGSDMSAGTP